jgi:hypothetical protein
MAQGGNNDGGQKRRRTPLRHGRSGTTGGEGGGFAQLTVSAPEERRGRG